MTREEAIEWVKAAMIDFARDDERSDEILTARDMAIAALEQNEKAEEWYKLFVEKLDEQEPCDDAISRENLFEVLDDFCGHDRTATITLDTLADIVYELPSVTQKSGEWLDVNERLPEEYADVICCADAKEVFIASYLGKLDDGTECFDDDNGMMYEGDVIAWIPLPKPYEPQESEDK